MCSAKLEREARRVLASYDLEVAASLRELEGGLINRTFLVESGSSRAVLQWVNPIFDPVVHEDIEVVTAHLAASGILTSRLIRTRDGALYVAGEERGCWRLSSYIEGLTHQVIVEPEMARSAGALVGRFHVALSGLSYVPRHRRPGVHDLARHLGALREALAKHAHHRNFARAQALGREILARADELPALAAVPARLAHGDLKISNILFSPGGEASSIIDLDTIAMMPLQVELGDAWRSWCNPAGEDAKNAAVSLPLLTAALEGYAASARGLLTAAELDDLPLGIETIALELAARFCADALVERYFAWDRARFTSASEHNLLRAQSQLGLAQSLADVRGELLLLVRQAFSG